MQYDDLTDDEKRVIDDMLTHLRSGAGTAAKLSHQAAQVIESADQTGANSALNKLDPGSPIPNHSGLGGAMAVTADDVRALLQIFGDVSQIEKNNSGLLIRAAGVNAIIRG